MREESVYLLKPEGMQKSREIHEMILAAGLEIMRRHEFIVPDWVVRALYPRLEAGHMAAILARLQGVRSEIGVVCGEAAIQRLLDLSGTSTNPLQCAEGTIRRRFWVSLGNGARDGWPMYGNVIHRSADAAEVLRDLEIERRIREE